MNTHQCSSAHTIWVKLEAPSVGSMGGIPIVLPALSAHRGASRGGCALSQHRRLLPVQEAHPGNLRATLGTCRPLGSTIWYWQKTPSMHSMAGTC